MPKEFELDTEPVEPRSSTYVFIQLSSRDLSLSSRLLSLKYVSWQCEALQISVTLHLQGTVSAVCVCGHARRLKAEV